MFLMFKGKISLFDIVFVFIVGILHGVDLCGIEFESFKRFNSIIKLKVTEIANQRKDFSFETSEINMTLNC